MTGAWHILVADDDAELRAWLRLALRPIAAVVEEVGSGQALLDRIADGDPVDAVVTDVRMPGPDGLKVVAMARTAGLDVPILVSTAFPDRAVRHTVAALDRTVLLAKPFEVDAFREALRHLIEGRGPEFSAES